MLVKRQWLYFYQQQLSVQAQITVAGKKTVIVFFDTAVSKARLIHDSDVAGAGTQTDICVFDNVTAVTQMAAAFDTTDFVVL